MHFIAINRLVCSMFVLSAFDDQTTTTMRDGNLDINCFSDFATIFKGFEDKLEN